MPQIDTVAVDSALGTALNEFVNGPAPKYRAEFGGTGENVWSNNAVEYPDFNSAMHAAKDKLLVWTGADIARVVTTDTPKRETIDLDDERIVVNYRS